MTANQYRAALAKLGLTQAQAAEYIGVSLRTSNGYANGEPIPLSVVILLRMLTSGKISVEDIETAHGR